MDIRNAIDTTMVTLSVVLYAAVFITCAAMVFAPLSPATIVNLAAQ